MNKKSKIICLLGCSLLAGVFVLNIENITIGEGVNINFPTTIQHEARLRSLFLGQTTDSLAWMSAGNKGLDILNGLVVYGHTNPVVGSDSQMVVIGGGDGNSISALNAGIVGGNSNTIMDDDSAIGGGKDNSIIGQNGVIAGGVQNIAGNGGVVVGGFSNIVSQDGTVILGGIANTSQGEKSLLMGSHTVGSDYSFAWRDAESEESVDAHSARIDASSGVLIGTMEPMNGVSLVVDGAVKLGKRVEMKDISQGEIMDYNGCLYAYNGEKWQKLGKDNAEKCNNAGLNIAKTCNFGGVVLQEGDVVTAYSKSYAPDCDAVKKDNVECKGGQLVSGESTEYVFPYCYNITKAAEIKQPSLNTAMLEGNDPVMNNFTWEEITIPVEGGTDIVIMDRNLGATDRWNIADVDRDRNGTYDETSAPMSYGYYYQWGNNYGFSPAVTTTTSPTQVPRGSGPYSSSTWINPNPWNAPWNSDASTTDDWTQGPCPSGWHVPSKNEWQNVYNALNAGSDGVGFAEALLLPPAGYNSDGSDDLIDVGFLGDYWSSSLYNVSQAYNLIFVPSGVYQEAGYRSFGYPIRCFKN